MHLLFAHLVRPPLPHAKRSVQGGRHKDTEPC